MIKICITLDNGQDKWLVMSSYQEQMAELLTVFGDDENEGKQICDVKSSVSNLSDYLRGMTVTSRVLKDLAFLNHRLEDMTEQERGIFGAILEIQRPYSVMEMVNLSCNMDKFAHYPEITDEALLGEYVMKKNSQMPKELAELLDYKAIGRKYAQCHAGIFLENGYTVRTGQALEALYDGQHLPDFDDKKNSLLVLKIGEKYYHTLYLPVSETKITEMEKNLGVSSLDECPSLFIQENVQGLKNRLPCGASVRELNHFVWKLQQIMDGTKEQYDKLFMALEAEVPASMDEAILIAGHLEQYQMVLSADEFTSPADYAHKVMEDSEFYYVDDFTADFVNYEALGKAMMREEGAVMTSYGIVVRNGHCIRQLPKELTTFKLFSPLYAHFYERNEYGDLENEPVDMEMDELCDYQDEILEAIERERLDKEIGRGLAVYLDNELLKRKVFSMNPTVEEWNGRLWGVLEVQSYGTLAEAELSSLINEWWGQESDGWGEGFEQREIKVDEGELCVSFWDSDNGFFIKTEQELKNLPEQNFEMQMR